MLKIDRNNKYFEESIDCKENYARLDAKIIPKQKSKDGKEYYQFGTLTYSPLFSCGLAIKRMAKVVLLCLGGVLLVPCCFKKYRNLIKSSWEKCSLQRVTTSKLYSLTPNAFYSVNDSPIADHAGFTRPDSGDTAAISAGALDNEPPASLIPKELLSGLPVEDLSQPPPLATASSPVQTFSAVYSVNYSPTSYITEYAVGAALDSSDTAREQQAADLHRSLVYWQNYIVTHRKSFALMKDVQKLFNDFPDIQFSTIQSAEAVLQHPLFLSFTNEHREEAEVIKQHIADINGRLKQRYEQVIKTIHSNPYIDFFKKGFPNTLKTIYWTTIIQEVCSEQKKEIWCKNLLDQYKSCQTGTPHIFLLKPDQKKRRFLELNLEWQLFLLKQCYQLYWQINNPLDMPVSCGEMISYYMRSLPQGDTISAEQKQIIELLCFFGHAAPLITSLATGSLFEEMLKDHPEEVLKIQNQYLQETAKAAAQAFESHQVRRPEVYVFGIGPGGCIPAMVAALCGAKVHMMDKGKEESLGTIANMVTFKRDFPLLTYLGIQHAVSKLVANGEATISDGDLQITIGSLKNLLLERARVLLAEEDAIAFQTNFKGLTDQEICFNKEEGEYILPFPTLLIDAMGVRSPMAQFWGNDKLQVQKPKMMVAVRYDKNLGKENPFQKIKQGTEFETTKYIYRVGDIMDPQNSKAAEKNQRKIRLWSKREPAIKVEKWRKKMEELLPKLSNLRGDEYSSYFQKGALWGNVFRIEKTYRLKQLVAVKEFYILPVGDALATPDPITTTGIASSVKGAAALGLHMAAFAYGAKRQIALSQLDIARHRLVTDMLTSSIRERGWSEYDTSTHTIEHALLQLRCSYILSDEECRLVRSIVTQKKILPEQSKQAQQLATHMHAMYSFTSAFPSPAPRAIIAPCIKSLYSSLSSLPQGEIPISFPTLKAEYDEDLQDQKEAFIEKKRAILEKWHQEGDWLPLFRLLSQSGWGAYFQTLEGKKFTDFKTSLEIDTFFAEEIEQWKLFESEKETFMTESIAEACNLSCGHVNHLGLKCCRSKKKLPEIWERQGLGKEYSKAFPSEESFWNSREKIMDVYQRLKKRAKQ